MSFKKYIVVVDDDPINNIITEKRFASVIEDLEMKVFEWASEALDYLKDTLEMPDLVLLDLNMPGITGWDFLDRCQELDIEVDVVILTSSIDNQDIEKADTYANVKAFISKPLNQMKVERIAELA